MFESLDNVGARVVPESVVGGAGLAMNLGEFLIRARRFDAAGCERKPTGFESTISTFGLHRAALVLGVSR